MNRRVELPLLEPLYSTYHYQGPCAAIAVNNPTIRNWYLNETTDLTCNRRFLNGLTTPEITVPYSSLWDCLYFEIIGVSSHFVGGYINRIIREMLDAGYYVVFDGIDDYYVEGKSWYKERHFNHDGLICGYDMDEKTYCLYSYDSKWLYRKFWTSQRSFNAGRIAMEKQGCYANFYAFKAKEYIIDFSPQTVYSKLKAYLDSDLEKYPFEGEANVYGIAVHAFIAEYVSRLYRADTPYERMDRRVFRLIWEHKKVMLERIELVQKSLGMNDAVSQRYALVVKDADKMRMLYASHHMKRRDSVLPLISKMLLKLMHDERKLLCQLVEKMERKLENESSVEISEK